VTRGVVPAGYAAGSAGVTRIFRHRDGLHGFFGEAAAFGALPFVVLFHRRGADEADHGGVVGQDAHDVGAALELFVDPLERVDRPDAPPVRLG